MHIFLYSDALYMTVFVCVYAREFSTACERVCVVTACADGPWTRTQTQWSNSYYTELLNNTWELYTGPGGAYQWRIVNDTNAIKVMMMTTDLALLHDPVYLPLVQLFADNRDALDNAFEHAWYKVSSHVACMLCM